MEKRFFMHRIKKDGDNFTKGIEVHDSLDAAILSYHSYMKQAYNDPSSPNVTFVSCKVTDGNGNIVRPYDSAWLKNGQHGNLFFMHYIRHDGESYTKGIDVCDDFDTAKRLHHAQMEYGYGNNKFPNVSFVSCLISDLSGSTLKSEAWNKPEPEPEVE